MASNAARVLKKYSRPSSSPGLGARVVAEIESVRSKWSATSRRESEVLPAPEGLDIRNSIPRRSVSQGFAWSSGAPLTRPHSTFCTCSRNCSMLALRSSPVEVKAPEADLEQRVRSEEHTPELQSLMRISYAVFCLKKKKHTKHTHT